MVPEQQEWEAGFQAEGMLGGGCARCCVQLPVGVAKLGGRLSGAPGAGLAGGQAITVNQDSALWGLPASSSRPGREGLFPARGPALPQLPLETRPARRS